MIKKIWLFAALFVAIMVGFSVFIIQISGYGKVYVDEPVVTQPVEKMIMKCGAGKCGDAMMQEANESVN